MEPNQDNGMFKLLEEAKALSIQGGMKNRELALSYLTLAKSCYASSIHPWIYYLDTQLEWYTRIKSIPCTTEIADMEEALCKVQVLSTDPELQQRYKTAVSEFWDNAAKSIREKTGYVSNLGRDTLDKEELSNILCFWKAHIHSKAFIALIEEAEANAVLVNRAQYIYDLEEYEWRKQRSYESAHVLLLLPAETVVKTADGRERHIYGDTSHILQVAKNEITPQIVPHTVEKKQSNPVSAHNNNSARNIGLKEVLAKPISLAKIILEQELTVGEINQILSETDIFNAYKGPFTSNIEAKFLFTDTIKVNCFFEGKQPTGEYLITYNMSYFEKYRMGLYVRVLTNSFKKAIKYRHFSNNHKINLKGKLDLLISGPMKFTSGSDNQQYSVNLVAVITVIDL